MASTIKVDNVQNQPGTNIINKCSTTITIGASSDTVALASGASQTGFGRTGTVDWLTAVKVTGDSPITGVDGKGYFLNTTAGTITVNLPAGAAGSIIAFKDYAGTWDTNNVTVTPNGSEKIAGIAGNGALSTERQSVTLIYIDSTQGWLDIHDSTSDVQVAKFVTATGGTPCAGAVVCTNFKQHTFTGPGTFCVSCAGNAGGSNTADYLVIAGAGGGGYNSSSSPSPDGGRGGAGGAGGYRESSGTATGCYTVSPLGAGVAALSVTATGYPITVGGGDPSGTPPGVGSNSIFSTITSNGGGRGGVGQTLTDGTAGASGGGSGTYGGAGAIGAGNTPPTSPPQGNDGGLGVEGSPAYGGGGGGGATAVGFDGSTAAGGNGGTGATSSINATPTARAGGGGGATGAAGPTKGCGTGGGGDGAALSCAPSTGGSGTANTGGGGGGSGGPNFGGTGGTGGSGVVIIRYKFQ
jgi:hypothetical protein